MAATMCTAETVWTDVTKRFVTNAAFDDDSNEGWTWDATTGTVGVSAGCLRFYSGTCTFSYQLSNLPKGTYRLSVQGFYRSSYDSYESYRNGTEDITAYLYANDKATPLVSVYSEGLAEPGVGNWQQHDGRYYPDNSSSSNAAFVAGLYKGNAIEFEAQGNVTIGVRCEAGESGNYCVLDNFKLEYATPTDEEGNSWIDITSMMVKNPGFDRNRTDGWEWDSDASSQSANLNCMEFWYGHFDFWQQIKGAPKGKYRLSVQAFYRVYENDWAYEDYLSGNENITAVMYAGESEKPLVSIYSESMNRNVGGCWGSGGKYYPNDMSSGRKFFENDLYWNTMEFEAEGDFRIGLRNPADGWYYSNWCMFDNFRLEYYGKIVKATAIQLTADATELVAGEQTTVNAVVQPATAIMTLLNWSSSDEQVATVDANGTVTTLGPGTVTITATTSDGSDVKGTITLTVTRNPATEGSLVINEIMASNIDEYISPAFNFDGWIELYNPTDRSVELGGVMVSDPTNGEGPWHMPKEIGVVPAKGYRLVWFDSNNIAPVNAPFKLDTEGGTIVLTTADGKEIASQSYPASMERVSYARNADGNGEWGHTDTPTPGASNNGIKLYQKQLAAPVIDQPSQLYTGKLTAKVTIPEGCTLRYTYDGSLPTLEYGMTSTNGVFNFDENDYAINLRLRLFADGMLPSRVTSRSYIYKSDDYYLPVISVVTDPEFLYSREIGVFEQGPNGRPGNGQSSKCNWNMDWERPVNFSYLDGNGKMVLNQDVNLEMCGGWSRAWYPHAFKLKGNKELGGEKDLLYPFFEQKPYIRNRTLQIRNGGNDNNARFKDPALQYIVQSAGMNLDCQSYQPVHEFINGSYIGVLNMREPNNKHYVYANYGWDDDEIDQFEMSPDSGYVQKCGTPDAFNELVDVLSPNADNSETYAEICRMLDIDAYANYMAAVMFLGNWDWPQNNVKGFRHRDGGKFRFVLFDLDGSFNTDSPFNLFFGKENYTFDQLYPTSLGRRSGQIRFVTLFKNLLKNADFCRRFIDAYCIMSGSVYQKDRSRQIINELVGRVAPAMSLEWSGEWYLNSTATEILDKLNSRLAPSSSALKNYAAFGLRNTTRQTVTLNSDTEGAKILINGQEVPTGRFDGHLFAPVTLRAEAPAGCTFKAWVNASGAVQSTDEEISLPTGTVKLTATFNRLSDSEARAQGITPVRINEVSGSNDSYIDEYGKKGDWIELYNTTDKEIDVEGMYLTDNVEKPTKYQITKGDTRANTKIPAHGFLVIWCDNKRATTDNGLHASFKIDGDGGQIALLAADQSWGDVLTYGAHDARTTVGRYPDGANDVYAMNVATIGARNLMTYYVTKVDQQNIDVAVRPIASANGLRLCYASRQLLVKSEGSQQVGISIYRTDGTLVEQAEVSVNSGSARLNVETLAPGFYVARATDSNGTSVSCKFIQK